MIIRRLKFMSVVLVFAAAALSRVPANAQSWDEIYEPGSTGNWFVWTPCGEGYTVSISVTAYGGSNGHFHEANRPTSAAVPSSGVTDQNGELNFTLTHQRDGFKVGQAETVAAHFNYSSGCAPAYNQFAVGYSDIYYNHHPGIWFQVGGWTTNHGGTSNNHWMESGSAYGLIAATVQYLDEHPPQTHICVNDMALPFGGKFDTGQNWTSPHVSHDRGSAVDIAVFGSGQCPTSYQVDIDEIVDACEQNGADLSASFPEGNHAHCNWIDPANYRN